MTAVNDFKDLSLSAIKEQLAALDPAAENAEILTALRSDGRKGVQKLADQLANQHRRHLTALAKVHELKAIELARYADGYQAVAGIDEVGRGPFAGPVVAAAVIMPPESEILGVNDSKQLSKKRREELAQAIYASGALVGIGEASAQEIDSRGIVPATMGAMAQAVQALSTAPELLLVDAVKLQLGIPCEAIVHGDATCYCIAAASIVAKVYRDNLMAQYAEVYPGYGFETNMGYGSASHITALKEQGPTPIHRRSFIHRFI